ncbi:hypothetical protein AB0M43_33685 [Longispora sp. NPDC051575]|uniref:hypothetical protein n=1 Tax=Longispora sp. NPDC051575 TaxID=3154943 RepID=UPI00341AF499
MTTFPEQFVGQVADPEFINNLTDEVTRLGTYVTSAYATWKPFTPTLTATPTSPNLGAGASLTGRYRMAGSLLTAEYTIVWGSSGISVGSGIYRLSLPRPPAFGVKALGVLWVSHPSTLAQQAGVCRIVGTGLEMIALDKVLSHALPWTWAAGDQIGAAITYENEAI